MLVPLAEGLTLVVTIPETAVEYGGKSFIPGILLLFGKGTIQYGSYRLLVALHYGIYVFWSTGTTLNLEDANAGIHHAVDEADGLQILRTHYILVVDFQLVAIVRVGQMCLKGR